MSEAIRTERRGAALWIHVDRPAARNALTFAMYDRIAAVCRDANGDATVKAVVLAGSSEAFVAGTDIAQFAEFTTAEHALEYERRMDEWLSAIEDVAVPTVAAPAAAPRMWTELKPQLARFLRWWRAVHRAAARAVTAPGRRSGRVRAVALCAWVDLAIAVLASAAVALVVSPLIGR